MDRRSRDSSSKQSPSVLRKAVLVSACLTTVGPAPRMRFDAVVGEPQGGLTHVQPSSEGESK